MSSTTYDHHSRKTAIFANEPSHFSETETKYCHFVDVNKMVYYRGNSTAMVRNAGQLPQPFWLSHGCGAGVAAFGSAWM